jgi:hypothetical protein
VARWYVREGRDRTDPPEFDEGINRVKIAGTIVIRAVLIVLLGTLASQSMVASSPTQAQDSSDSVELQLAEKYAPIVMLKAQEAPCDNTGEQWSPSSVDIVLDNPDVVLRQVGNNDPIIKIAPTASDLFGLSEGFYLDYPGAALAPGCIYETDFDRYSNTGLRDRQALVYAHIARQADQPDQLALQYWSYWYYNDWNNKHEGDWEGIQLLFDTGSVEEALAREPVSVGYAQHEGGERADWNSDKLERDGDRPVIYPSAGSHASYFGSALYIGRSASEGFGCDTTDGPSDRVSADIELLPTDVQDADDPLAWLTFGGRWGERHSGAFNGPTGPPDKERWANPIDWHNDLRSDSVIVPAGDSQADLVFNTFCQVVEWGSVSLIKLKTSPLQLIVAFALVFFVARWLVRRTLWNRVSAKPLIMRRRAGQIIRSAGGSYRHNARALIAFGLIYIPTAVVVGVIAGILLQLPVVGELVELAGSGFEIGVLFILLAGGIANLVSYVAVNSMVAAYYEQSARGDGFTPREAVKHAWGKAPSLAAGFVRSVLIVSVLVLSIVGIPWGIRQLIRYQFMPQAVILEDLDGRESLARSTELVRGRWWHTAVMIVLFNVLIATSGMVVGLVLLLIFAGIPLWAFTGLVTLVYALIVPLAAVAQTLLYGDAVAENDQRRRGQTPPSHVNETVGV